MAEGEYYYHQRKSTDYDPRDDTALKKAVIYYERSAALGCETALMKAGNSYHFLGDPTKARALLVEASNKGISELTMYTALGLYYLEGIGGPADGKKADHYLAHFNDGKDPYMLRLHHGLRARLYSYGLNPIKPDIVAAFSYIREALMIDNKIDETLNWYDFYTLARGHRYGLLVETDPVKALKYYNMVLTTYQSCKAASSVAQPHLPRILREANEYKEKMKRGKESLLKDPQERTTRFKLLLASAYNTSKHPQSALQYFLGRCYFDGDGVPKDMKTAKEYLIKASYHPRNPMPPAVRLLTLIYARERNEVEMMKCISLADTLSDQIPSGQLCDLYYLGMLYCMEMVEKGKKTYEADLLKYCDKLILQKLPYGWYAKGRAYNLTLDTTIKKNAEKVVSCFVNAEKLFLAQTAKDGRKGVSHPHDDTLTPELRNDKRLLEKIYLEMGECYLKEISDDEKEERKTQPLNREKGVMYLEKALSWVLPRPPPQ